MTRHTTPPPPPLSQQQRHRILRAKLISLAGSVIVALSAGSNYAFSSFAPQLQDAIALSSTQINLIGIAGNAGVYLSSPLWGRFIDARGPRTAILTAAAIVPIGYAGLSIAYRRHSTATPTSLLVLLNLLTGIGNSGSFTAAMNAQAKSWGGQRRGTATALVLSGFGLSAFFYSTLSHALFADNTADYLLLLAFGSMASMLIGLAIVRPSPPLDDALAVPSSGGSSSGDAAGDPLAIPYRRRRTSSEIDARTAIWNDEDETDAEQQPGTSARRHLAPRPSQQQQRSGDDDNDDDDTEANAAAGAHERQSLLSSNATTDDASKPTSTAASAADGTAPPPSAADDVDISGKRLFRQVDFLLLFCVMALVSGAGLLLINNVGTITKTLWDYNHRDRPEMLFDRRSDAAPAAAAPAAVAAAASSDLATSLKLSAKATVQKLQAHQVSAISLCNASGRILIGLLSDLVVNRTGSSSQRVWLLSVVTTLALGSQLLAALPGLIVDVDRLLAVSMLTGLSYGTLFGLCPVLMFEWFGMRHFSQNYGFLSLSPVLAGNVFNLVFGRVYDSHVPRLDDGRDGKNPTSLLTAAMGVEGGTNDQLTHLVRSFRRRSSLAVDAAAEGSGSGGAGGHNFCIQGAECYRQVFVITTLGCVVALVASGILIARRARRSSSGGSGGGVGSQTSS